MDDVLYCVQLSDDSEQPALTGEMLSALEMEFSSWEDRENHRFLHTVYAQTPEESARNRRRIGDALELWREFGVAIGGIREIELRREDWAEAWKKYFDLIPISDRLIVKPSWIEYTPKPGQKVLEIDPGMSFGTGQHATTFFCLKTIARFAGTPGMRSMLDAGCGSGILAIGAALLGYEPVEAFDYDPDAVRIATENLAANRIGSVRPAVADAADFPGRPERYDLVCANILGHLLKAYRGNIAGWVRPGGCLALAGILEREYDGVRDAYTAIGFEELDRETLREWTSGLFRKKQ